MEVKVYNQETAKKEVPLFLKLEQGGEGVLLRVVDEHGKPHLAGCLLTVHGDGRIELHSGVSKRFGLKLSKVGHVVTYEE